MTEYAIMLFLLLVVGAAAWKVFGDKVDSGMGKTASHLENQSDPPPSAGGGGGGSPKAISGGGAGAGTTGAAGEGGFGGARVATKEQQSSGLPKFALVALGIVGGAAAFFSMLKGKHAR